MEKLADHILPPSFMQFLAAGLFIFHLWIHIISALTIGYVVFCTDFWPIIVASIVWTINDWKTPFKGGRQSSRVKHFPLWRYLKDYFPATLVKTADLDQNKNYIFCTHPHGVICLSSIIHFVIGYSKAFDLFPGLKYHTATLNFNFCFPILRDYSLSLGFISASRDSLTYVLNEKQKGNVVNLMVGGAAESAFIDGSGKYKIILNKRKGFIKIALITGCCLVPVICFGENDPLKLTGPPPGGVLETIQKWFRSKTGVSLALPTGRSGLLKLLPRRTPLTTVVGEPIEVPKIPDPSKEEIEKYHTLYTKELMKLFNKYKYKYIPDPENNDLIIVE